MSTIPRQDGTAATVPSQSQIARLDPISWVPYATRFLVADYLLRGHPYCVQYATSSWPESVLPQAHWEYFNSLPATSPYLPTVILRLPGRFGNVEVHSTSHYVTVADILRALYDNRARYRPNTVLIGLSYSGHENYVNVHLDV